MIFSDVEKLILLFFDKKLCSFDKENNLPGYFFTSLFSTLVTIALFLFRSAANFFAASSSFSLNFLSFIDSIKSISSIFNGLSTW